MMKQMGWTWGVVLAVVGSTSLMSTVAQAEDAFTTLAGDAVAVSGGLGMQAKPTLTFDFGSQYDLVSFTLRLNYDGSLMAFNAAESTLSNGSTSASLSAVLNELAMASTPGDFVVIPPNVGPDSYSLSVYYGSLTGHYPIPAGTAVFTAVFDLAQPFAPGLTPPTVTFSGDLGNAAFELHGFREVAAITAVPEAEIWMMLLGGLRLAAVRVRRRNR